MTYRVVSGFQDLETEVFYDIHTEIDEENKNLKKYLKAGVVEKVDEEIIDEDTVEEEVATNDEKKTENTKDAKKKG